MFVKLSATRREEKNPRQFESEGSNKGRLATKAFNLEGTPSTVSHWTPPAKVSSD